MNRLTLVGSLWHIYICQYILMTFRIVMASPDAAVVCNALVVVIRGIEGRTTLLIWVSLHEARDIEWQNTLLAHHTYDKVRGIFQVPDIIL